MNWIQRLFKKRIKKTIYGIEAWHWEVPDITKKEKLEIEKYLIHKYKL